MTVTSEAARRDWAPLRAPLDRAARIAALPVISYLLIAALQLRVVWNVWRYKDFTFGDVAGYFTMATSWTHGLHESIVYSPLYAAIWGTILAVVNDVYAAAAVNRLLIIFAVSLLVLAVLRALFTPAVALLLAIWWAVDPANYNVLYDVHIFGLVPVLVAALVVARVPGRTGRGIALALLAAEIVLLRNEMLLATLIFGMFILVAELRARRSRPVAWRSYALAYGIPLLIALLAVGGAYWRSYIQGDEAVTGFKEKQALNLCEAYAFNYQQRFPARVPGNSFLECQRIMRHDFGRPMPSFFQAVGANPRAMAGFVAWNVKLLPTGMEVALFNATDTGKNPGYVPVLQNRKYARILAIIALVALLAGLACAWREREYWRGIWARRHAWPLILLGSAAFGTLIVVLTERPWADYMFPFTFGLLVLVGVALQATLRASRATRLAAPASGVLAVALIAALPSFYTPGPRPIHDGFDRVQVIRSQLQKPHQVLVGYSWGNEICFYGARSFDRSCTSIDWPTLRAQVAAGVPVQKALKRAGATAIYADAMMVGDPLLARFLAAPGRAGWRQVAGGVGADGPWRVLTRVSPTTQ